MVNTTVTVDFYNYNEDDKINNGQTNVYTMTV